MKDLILLIVGMFVLSFVFRYGIRALRSAIGWIQEWRSNRDSGDARR